MAISLSEAQSHTLEDVVLHLLRYKNELDKTATELIDTLTPLASEENKGNKLITELITAYQPFRRLMDEVTDENHPHRADIDKALIIHKSDCKDGIGYGCLNYYDCFSHDYANLKEWLDTLEASLKVNNHVKTLTKFTQSHSVDDAISAAMDKLETHSDPQLCISAPEAQELRDEIFEMCRCTYNGIYNDFEPEIDKLANINPRLREKVYNFVNAYEDFVDYVVKIRRCEVE